MRGAGGLWKWKEDIGFANHASSWHQKGDVSRTFCEKVPLRHKDTSGSFGVKSSVCCPSPHNFWALRFLVA
jgi:hypothetical protein